MGSPRQDYWSGLPFPSPGDLPHPVIRTHASRFFTKNLVLSWTIRKEVIFHLVLHNLALLASLWPPAIHALWRITQVSPEPSNCCASWASSPFHPPLFVMGHFPFPWDPLQMPPSLLLKTSQPICCGSLRILRVPCLHLQCGLCMCYMPLCLSHRLWGPGDPGLRLSCTSLWVQRVGNLH